MAYITIYKMQKRVDKIRIIFKLIRLYDIKWQFLVILRFFKINNAMNKKNLLGRIFAFAVLATVVFGTTSCNRGYGCPYNTSVSQFAKVIDFSILK